MVTGEEAGPKSNKMGGIWNVIDGEALTFATLFNSGTLELKDRMKYLLLGLIMDIEVQTGIEN